MSADFHHQLLGIEPEPWERAFYEAGASGFDSDKFDAGNFRVTFILALYRAGSGGVVLSVPKSMEKQVLDEIRKQSRLIMRRFKGKTEIVKTLVKRVRHLYLATRFLGDVEPERWVAFGFSTSDPIPNWMKAKLWQTTKS